MSVVSVSCLTQDHLTDLTAATALVRGNQAVCGGAGGDPMAISRFPCVSVIMNVNQTGGVGLKT